MWLQNSGRTAADFPMDVHSSGFIHNGLLQPTPNLGVDLAKTIAPALANYMQQKKNDEIANQLLALQSAQKATPVLDQNGQPINAGGGPMNAAAVSSFNTSLGFPGTAKTPDRGGTAGYRMQKMYQDFLNEQPDTATDDENFLKLYRSNHPEEFPQPSPHGPEYVDTPYGRMTAQQWADHQWKENNPPVKAHPWDGSSPLARGKLDSTGEFTNQYTGAGNGDMVQLHMPDGKVLVVPFADYQNYLQKKKTPPIGAQMFQSRQQDSLPSPDLPPVTDSQAAIQPSQPSSNATPKPASKADYDALPSGTLYYAPDGTRHRKP
jgi:hypothetical protein